MRFVNLRDVSNVPKMIYLLFLGSNVFYRKKYMKHRKDEKGHD